MERSVLITGANGGLGNAFVSQLVKQSSYGIYAVRDPSTAQNIPNILSSTHRSHYKLLTVDPSTLDSVPVAAAWLNKRVSSVEIPPIQTLVLNSAVQHVEGKVITVDEFESHFAVNYLANFLFVLMKSESMNQERGRFVMIFTALHNSYHWMSNSTLRASEKEMFRDIHTNCKWWERWGGLGRSTWQDMDRAGIKRYKVRKCLPAMFV
jgi:NAD(P)-dependent dehydrogenase (short-subunit alcohol dehydrogenase family)